ncbi:hypothetical protein R1flu_002564 [Riccia fluitans]|uniref:Uncharacterized protein n=1 Tax=Riccia fluitans TaxID=41844 RepID=A0ABD1Y7H1_9MARC
MDMEVRNRWRLIVFELLVLSPIFSYVTSERPKGFISIDCGGIGGPDSDTGLDRDTDEAYLITNAAVKATVYAKQDSDCQINGKQLQSAMVSFQGQGMHTRFSSDETESYVPTYRITFARWNFGGNHSHQLRFGVVLMEIVSGRKCLDRTAPEDPVYLRDWAFRLHKEKMLLSMLDKELTEDHNEEEVVLVLEMALACCQNDSAKRPTMTQVVNKLMKHSDVAVDIVPEVIHRPGLGDVELQPLQTVHEDESEESSLLASSSALVVQGSPSTIELANMLHSRRVSF